MIRDPADQTKPQSADDTENGKILENLLLISHTTCGSSCRSFGSTLEQHCRERCVPIEHFTKRVAGVGENYFVGCECSASIMICGSYSRVSAGVSVYIRVALRGDTSRKILNV